jgi:serine/threonine-protein kinase
MHAKGIVHRDLKPDNIVFQDQNGSEVIKVLDFGIAKLATPSIGSQLTQTGTVVGTPSYMSPEQCQAGKIDGRSDIYALGVILFQMLTGTLPFESDNLLTMMYLHVNQEPPAASDREPRVPARVSDIVKRMMAKRPDDRFESASSCARALAEASGVDIPVRDVGDTPKPAKTIARAGVAQSIEPSAKPALGGRKRLVYGAVGVVAIALAVGGAFYVRQPNDRTTTSASPGPAPVVQENPILAEQFVLIPSGRATIGSNLDDCRNLPSCKISFDEAPSHTVDVAPFYLAKYEVTNREYSEFVQGAGYKAPRGWRGTYPTGSAQMPVTNVTWDDAVAYVKWRSQRDGIAYRLPTQDEWEYAARGNDARAYPWGDFWNDSFVNGNKEPGKGDTIPVDQPPNSTTDVSPFRVFGLGGNVSEWTSSAFAAYEGSRYKPKPGDLDSKVIRGGAYDLDPNSIRSSYRYWKPPSYSSSDLGFRLAADVPDAHSRAAM